MSRRQVIGNNEPRSIAPDMADYASALSHAFNYYNQEKDKKEARNYIREYVAHTFDKTESKKIDRVPDSKIVLTYAWLCRMSINGAQFNEKDKQRLDEYVAELLREPAPVVETVEVKPTKPSIQDYMQEKAYEVIGEFEGMIDDLIKTGKEIDAYSFLQSNSVPKPYCNYIDQWARKRVQEFIGAYEGTDKDLKEAYSFLGKRQLAGVIKGFNSIVGDLERYAQFKKANRKPRVKKAKPPAVQVKNLKYKKEDTLLNIRSVNPSEIIGASQVWVYNCKYKRLAAYRTDSAQGIQVKGTTLQNYDPEMCEQRSVRRPEVVLKRVQEVGKVQLRKLLSDLATAEYDVTGRINEECLIVRVIK